MNWLAIDIGGANIKIADAHKFAVTRSFALWSRPAKLAHELRDLFAGAPAATHLVVTMTGELADCFASKQEGVTAILEAVESAAARFHQRVYLTNGDLVTPAVAKRTPELAAASNWHALARYASRFVSGAAGLLVDIGSTTTDVVPIVRGEVAAAGTTDTQRLGAHELIYTGVERTPACAIASCVPYRGRQCRIAQELFATMRDVYMLLGHLPEDPTCMATADGRAATKANARSRLGRMICADDTEFNHRDAAQMASALARKQQELLVGAIRQRIERMSEVPASIIISGKGEFLARKVLEQLGLKAEVTTLSAEIGCRASVAATAFALATLCQERT